MSSPLPENEQPFPFLHATASSNSSPFVDQILNVLIMLKVYPHLEGWVKFSDGVMEYCKRGTQIVDLEHEQILLVQNLITLINNSPEFTWSEVETLFNELDLSVQKTERLALQLTDDFLNSTALALKNSPISASDDLVEDLISVLKVLKKVQNSRRSIMARLPEYLPTPPTEEAKLRRFRNLTTRYLRAFVESQQHLFGTFQSFSFRSRVWNEDAIGARDLWYDKLSDNVVDLVLEWERNKKEG